MPFALRSLARWRAALAVAALVLLGHGLLLGLWRAQPGPGWQAQPARPLQLRRIEAAPAMPAAVTPAAAPTPPPAPRRVAPTAAATGPRAPASTAALALPATPESVADPGGQTVPVYATALPPPATLQFELRRAGQRGPAQLDWRPAAEHYQLTLQGPAIGWFSVGGFDAAGVAPLRYVERRRGRELRAANFQRDIGRIGFSGPAVEYPLVDGAQDRLSWMLQLAGVLQANPPLSQPQAQVSMWVVGTRGDAEVWTFTVSGRAALDLPIGRIEDLVHLQREPRRPYDTQVQVWLDPARHFLPAQLWLRVRANGEGSEFRLHQIELH